MASATMTFLSRNDSAVMRVLFEPEASLSQSVRIDGALSEPYDHTTMSTIKLEERQVLLLINEERPSIWTVQSARQRLSQIIHDYPKYASAWNNRAQATRMLFDLSDASLHPAKIRSIHRDLSTAIETAEACSSHGLVSPSAARVLSSAHTHRGYLLWHASRPEAADGMLDAVSHLRGLDKVRLEELASKEFSSGARYGNKTARQLAVKTNPYAKLCGSIVREAIIRDIEESSCTSALTS